MLHRSRMRKVAREGGGREEQRRGGRGGARGRSLKERGWVGGRKSGTVGRMVGG
jgi:hypothetical protein